MKVFNTFHSFFHNLFAQKKLSKSVEYPESL